MIVMLKKSLQLKDEEPMLYLVPRYREGKNRSLLDEMYGEYYDEMVAARQQELEDYVVVTEQLICEYDAKV